MMYLVPTDARTITLAKEVIKTKLPKVAVPIAEKFINKTKSPNETKK